LVCPSGLGHLSRTVEVVNFIESIKSDIDITIHLATWQAAYARKWIKNLQTSFVPVNAPFVPTSQGRRSWTEIALANTEFDFLVSDNLIEVVEFNETLALVGSFLWGTENISFEDETSWIRTNKMSIPIFGVDFLSMPAVRSLSGFQPVGLVGKCQHLVNHGKEILFSFGRSNAAKELCDRVRDTICPRGKLIEGFVFDDIENTEPVGDYSEDFFARFSSAVIRPGVGTLSDCLRYGVPMVILHENGNDEIEWNTKILVENGLAVVAETADEALIAAHAWDEETWRSKFHERRQALRWEGEKDIAQGIIRCLEKKL